MFHHQCLGNHCGTKHQILHRKSLSVIRSPFCDLSVTRSLPSYSTHGGNEMPQALDSLQNLETGSEEGQKCKQRSFFFNWFIQLHWFEKECFSFALWVSDVSLNSGLVWRHDARSTRHRTMAKLIGNWLRCVWLCHGE